MKCIVICYLFVLCYIQYVNNLKSKSNAFLKEQKNIFSEIKNLIKDNVIIENEDIDLKEYGSLSQNSTNKNVFYLYSENKDSINEKKTENIISEIFFYKNIKEKGWDKLTINSFRGKNNDNDYFSSFKQAYFSGYLEGRFTFQDINNFHKNIETNYKKKNLFSIIKEIKNFLRDVSDSMFKKVDGLNDLNEDEKNYYYKIYIFYCQLHGMLKGYNKQVNLVLNSNIKTEYPVRNLKIEDLLLVQTDGEIPELMRYFIYQKHSDTYKLEDRKIFKKIFNIDVDDPKRIWKRLMWRSRCSVFIKLIKNEANEFSDLFSGHNAWSEYTETYKTFKNYNFDFYDDLNGKSLRTNVMFSSYPGCISSTDDYYVTDKKLMVTETTLDVIDMNVYKKVKSSASFIPNFMRINAASLFSNSGKEWVKNFSFFNSGTYSSQWIILDYKVFDNLKNTKSDSDDFTDKNYKGLLYVLEQVPNSMIYHDVTEKFIQQGYYASFNRAFFSETKNSVNEDLVRELYGDVFTNQGSERAKIFKKLHRDVKSFKDFKDVMRYNGFKLNRKDFPDDPSNLNPGYGISSRYDLDQEFNLSGGIDCKVTNYKMINNLSSAIISGPTNENNENLTTFSWKAADRKDLSIDGLPEKYNFPWLLASPENIKNNNKNDAFKFE